MRTTVMFSWFLALIGCGTSVNPTADLPPLDRIADLDLFFPILRNFSNSDLFAQTIVHSEVTDDLAVFACRRIPRPEGRIGIDYVMRQNLSIYGMTEEEVLDACFKNFFAEKINVEVREQDTSKLYQFTSSGGLVAAILGHRGTYARFSELTQSPTMAVLIMSPDVICVTATGSSFEEGFHDIAKEINAQDDPIDLKPSVYYWTTAGKLVSEPQWRQAESHRQQIEKK